MTAFDSKMNFELVEDSINTILEAEEADNDYQVLRYDPDSNSAEAIEAKRQVVCYFASGNFPTVDNVSSNDQTQHIATYKLLLTVAEKSKDKATGFEEAGLVANARMNDFARRIWQIIMQGENIYLGTDDTTKLDPTIEERYGIISSRHIESIIKSSIDKDGGHAIIRAEMDLVCQMSESPYTISGVAYSDADTVDDVTSDPSGQDYDTSQMGTNVTP
jgi:hypothetical protein